MTLALQTRKVDGLIVDTYVAGARKELFSELFRVRKVFDHMSAYGIALAGDAIKLQRCFSKYIRANQASIYHEIDKVVEPIEVSGLPLALNSWWNCQDKSFLVCTVYFS